MTMIRIFKYSLDQKGWLLAIILAIIGPLLPIVIYEYFPSLKDDRGLSFSQNHIVVENNTYHKTVADAEKDCSSGRDESMQYLNYHTNTLGFDGNTDPRIIFDTAVWGISLSDCYSNPQSEELSLYLLRVLVASSECGGTWKAYSSSARAFLESYIGDHVVIDDETLPVCVSPTTPAT